ncbi:MAG: hypothetical protein HC899_05550 [Leptolyngbyaceae cyanobacterium SM1_4_3]|nr:hypothetical protein [Leptolyngbyaceae cyanobacterium SM1_4_3]NJN89863.1 hypothetical protein [Leptolyngbyaceae cyanobacterium SL_5_14]
MTRRKRSSKVVEQAERRIAGLESINATLDLGNGLTLSTFEEMIEEAKEKLRAYNTILSSVDVAYNQTLEADRALQELSERVLLGVASKYGKDSHEYEMAGGVRKSERKRRISRAKSQTSS